MKILSVFGTRPEAIKMAPLVQAIGQDPAFESLLAVTAQHRDMLDQVLDLFDLVPDYDLDIMQPNQTISMITSHVLLGLDDILEAEAPDLVLVHGDTSTTFATALSAFYHRIPVGHVEAGLRTFNPYSPFPEEMNRVLTGHLAHLHFAPTQRNRKNLLREGIDDSRIFVTGNTVIDALLQVADMPYVHRDEILSTLDFSGKKIITVTCHRRENLGEYMEQIFRAIGRIARDFPQVEVVYPVHLNPRVRQVADRLLGDIPGVHLIPPLAYQPFVRLMADSHLIITDSGGMQEEAPALGKPVLVVRRETERPEAVEAGTVRLAGVEEETIYRMTRQLLEDQEAYEAMAHAVNPYGDGQSSARIVAALKDQGPFLAKR